MSAPPAHLFLVSTPLHLLVSLAIIGKEGLENCQLWFIDQDPNGSSLYRDKLMAWGNQPFKQIEVFYRPKKNFSKLKHRKATFAQIAECLQHNVVSDVYVGNNRRIEFQYAMHLLSCRQDSVCGHYMDEGTFTYVGRAASASFSDRVLDNALKKLFYGSWWKHPKTVGASDWVQHIYASLPQQIHSLLKAKKITALDNQYWQSDLLQSFCQQLLEGVADISILRKVDVLLTLPHESLLNSSSFDSQLVFDVLDTAIQKKLAVAVKYHPRDKEQDALQLQQKGVDLLPAGIPFEAMLPLLKAGVEVIGDFSTTLITSKLLKPDAKVFALPQNNDKMAEFLDLYQALGIEVLTLNKS